MKIAKECKKLLDITDKTHPKLNKLCFKPGAVVAADGYIIIEMASDTETKEEAKYK